MRIEPIENQKNGMNNNTYKSSNSNEFFSLQDYIRILSRRRWIIIAIFIVVAGAIAYNASTTHPIYQATATVMITEETTPAQELFGGAQRQSGTSLTNQMAFLRSRSLSEEVVKRLAESQYADDSYLFGTADPISPNFFTQLKRLPAQGIGLANRLISGLTDDQTVTNSQAESQENRSNTSAGTPANQYVGEVQTPVLNVRNTPSLVGEKIGEVSEGRTVDIVEIGEDWSQIRYNDLQGWVSTLYLDIDTLQYNIRYDGTPVALNESTIRGYAGRLRSWMSLNPIREAQMLAISVQAPDNQEAAMIANTVAEVYYEMSREIAREEVRQERQFLQSQLEESRQSLNEAELALKNFQENSESIALDQSTNNLVARISEFQSQLDQALIERRSTENRINYLRDRLSEQEQRALDTLSTVTAPYLSALQDTLANAKLQLTIMMTNPEIERNPQLLNPIEQRIARLENELNRATQRMISQGVENLDPIGSSTEIVQEIITAQSQLVLLEMREEQLQNMIEKYNQQMESVPDKTLQLARLERDRRVNEELFTLIRTRYEEARIEEAAQGGNVQIVDDAIAPGSPIMPDMQRSLMAAIVLGIGFGFGVAFLVEVLDQKLHGPDDIERTGLEMLGGVPEIAGGKKKESAYGTVIDAHQASNGQFPEMKKSKKLNYYMQNPVVEAYRVIGTNILFRNPDHPRKSILITSPGPREGKSMTASNVAVTMAQMGKKTLLIDADLRKPTIHQVMKVKRSPGITDALIGEQDKKNIIQPTRYERLDVVAAGQIPPNPYELLGSSRMQEILDAYQSEYDMVIVDSAPVFVAADSIVLATKVTSTVIVASANSTEKRALIRAAEQLKKLRADIIGVVLNRVKEKEMEKDYYYTYKYMDMKTATNGQKKEKVAKYKS